MDSQMEYSSVKTALGIDVIVDTIFSHLSLTELLSVRKVSRKWNECSLAGMKKLKNRFKSVKMDVMNYNEDGYGSDTSTSDFTDDNICKMESKFQKFCETWGTGPIEDILPTRFTIPDHCFSPKFLASREGIHAMRFYLQYCPKILNKMTIVVKEDNDDDDERTYLIPEYLKDILLQKTNILFPALQSLHFQLRGSFSTDKVLKFKSAKKAEFKDLKFVQNAQYNEIQRLRCLKSLTIFPEIIFELEWTSSFFDELAKIAPNLIKISFPEFHNLLDSDTEQDPIEMRKIERNFPIYKFLTFPQGKICHYSNLQFTCVNDEIVKKLLELTKWNQMKIKELTVHVEHYTDTNYLQEFFKLQRENIVEIDLRKSELFYEFFYEEEGEMRLNRHWKIDSRMPNLKKLTISSITALLRLNFDEMKENFPSLETLNFFYITPFASYDLDYRKPSLNIFFWNHLLSLKDTPLLSVKELGLLNTVIGENSLKALPSIFPNVNCITLSIAQEDVEEILPVVWSLWSDTLKKLTLVFVSDVSLNNLDQLFIGDNGANSIKNLKALTHLTIFGKFCLNSKKICSLFLEMKNLAKICYIDTYRAHTWSVNDRTRRFSYKCQDSFKKKNIHCVYYKYKLGLVAAKKLLLPLSEF